MTNSPLDNRAGMLSLVPVPGPVTRPPAALPTGAAPSPRKPPNIDRITRLASASATI